MSQLKLHLQMKIIKEKMEVFLFLFIFIYFYFWKNKVKKKKKKNNDNSKACLLIYQNILEIEVLYFWYLQVKKKWMEIFYRKICKKDVFFPFLFFKINDSGDLD